MSRVNGLEGMSLTGRGGAEALDHANRSRSARALNSDDEFRPIRGRPARSEGTDRFPWTLAHPRDYAQRMEHRRRVLSTLAQGDRRWSGPSAHARVPSAQKLPSRTPQRRSRAAPKAWARSHPQSTLLATRFSPHGGSLFSSRQWWARLRGGVAARE
jgi:hypothetical protein